MLGEQVLGGTAASEGASGASGFGRFPTKGETSVVRIGRMGEAGAETPIESIHCYPTWASGGRALDRYDCRIVQMEVLSRMQLAKVPRHLEQ